MKNNLILGLSAILVCCSILAEEVDSTEPVFVPVGPDEKIESETNLEKETEEKEQKEKESSVDQKKPKEKDPVAQAPPEGKLPEALVQLGDEDYFSNFAFVADKKNRTLTIWQRESSNFKFVKAYPIDMGRVNGDKLVLGDKKTPEGVYYFIHMYQGSNLNFEEYGKKAFVMDYPNFYDRKERKTGSGIWLHAIPDHKSLYRGSRGCLVVRNDVIDDVGSHIDLKQTPVIVQDVVNYVTPRDRINMRTKLNLWIQNWKMAWEKKQLDDYMKFYSEEFKSLGKDKNQWKSYKEGLNNKYNEIRVTLSQPEVFKHDNEIVVRFLQDYRSDKLQDFGEKTLYLKQSSADPNQFEILGEVWKPVNNKLLAQKLNQSEAPKN